MILYICMMVCIHRYLHIHIDTCDYIRQSITEREKHENIFLWQFLFLSVSYHGIVLCLATQPCLTLCDPMDCSPPGSSVHGILQARILEWVAMSSSRVLCYIFISIYLLFFCRLASLLTIYIIYYPNLQLTLSISKYKCVNLEEMIWFMFIHIHDPVNFSRSRDGEFKKNTTYQTLVHVSSLRYKKGSQGGEKRTEMSGAAGRFIISIPYIFSTRLIFFWKSFCLYHFYVVRVYYTSETCFIIWWVYEER